MNKKISKITAMAILSSMLMYTIPVSAFTKDETVYSNIDSNGGNYKTVVTTRLENTDDEKVLKDLTNLLNIENTSGDEKFTQDGETLVWEANTNDIYYKGETSRELPIQLNIKYELEEKEVKPEELAGKTGKVKIIIEFKNKDEHKLNVNGKEETMYTPFIVACGTHINNEKNKNIEVKNGKAIDDGTKTMIIGFVFPGIQESLKLDKSIFEIPEVIEITMETKEFEMNNIVSIITPKIVEEADLNIFNELDKIYDKVEVLQSASKTIETGAKKLEDGTNEYSVKSVQFNNAINEFSKGMNSASTNYKVINSGIEELNSKTGSLQTGSKQLSDGLSQTVSGVNQMKLGLNNSNQKVPELLQGTEKVSNGLEQLNQNITVTDNTEILNNIRLQIKKDQETIKKLTTQSQTIQETIKTNELSEEITEILKTQVKTNEEAIISLTYDYNYLKNILVDLEKTDKQMKILKENLTVLSTGANQVNDGVKTLAGSVSQLTSGLETLSTTTDELSKGAVTLYNGSKQLTAGTNKLKKGSNQMQSGLEKLDISTKEIQLADSQLTEGAKTINEGSKELSIGIQEFNRSGIEKICNYVNNDIKNVTIRAEKLKELSDKYNTFTKLNEEENGKVKFITIVDSIKKDENESQEKIYEKKSK